MDSQAVARRSVDGMASQAIVSRKQRGGDHRKLLGERCGQDIAGGCEGNGVGRVPGCCYGISVGWVHRLLLLENSGNGVADICLENRVGMRSQTVARKTVRWMDSQAGPVTKVVSQIIDGRKEWGWGHMVFLGSRVGIGSQTKKAWKSLQASARRTEWSRVNS
ncbi:hypothetical protein chiPu_0024768, partial [Chiloscyllium punctatum]|nr:hypothetical protein [Chiloscyllium punctatum]